MPTDLDSRRESPKRRSSPEAVLMYFTISFGVLAFLTLIGGIWSGDQRWVETGGVLAGTSALVGVISWLTWMTRNERW